MSLGLRELRRSDIDAGLRLCRACGWNQLAEDWKVFLDSSGAGGFVAVRDDVVLGSVAFLRYAPCFAWIAMMLVDPQERRAGIASRLMEAALAALVDETSIRLDATPVGEPLYRRYGFTGESSLLRTKVVVTEGAFPSSRGNARPMQPADLPNVFERDRIVFGADRSALLAALYRRAPELAWIDGDSFCFGRDGYLYHQLGPIVADAEEIAAGLVSQCLAQQAGKRFAIDVPQHSPKWIDWIRSAGFEIERPFLRMVRGERVAQVEAAQFGIGGPEFA